MNGIARRILSSRDLGRARRRVDLLLGVASIVPLVAGATSLWPVPLAPAPLVQALCTAWAGSLLAFFAGVRRGLTFSEAGGGRVGELLTMLAVFALGVASLIALSPWLAALGLAVVAVADALAARRGEAPDYFSRFRPIQLGIGVVALIAVQLGR